MKALRHVLLLDARSNRKNAGPKARLDTAHFLRANGFHICHVPTSRSRYWQRLIQFFLRRFDWVGLQTGDVVWCQFPVDRCTQTVLENARNRGLQTVAFVHDIEGLKRDPVDGHLVTEEAHKLRQFTAVMGLNRRIGELLQSHGVLVHSNLHMWDYLCEPPSAPGGTLNKRIVFAGSLAYEKSKFIYALDSIPNVPLELYGEGLDPQRKLASHVRYCGSFAPDSPPFRADGALGLVWDGDQTQTCSGDFGIYLRFNTPHKTSMYLASGLPVVVWRQAAIAPLVAEHQAGLLIDSLEELQPLLGSLSDAQYAELAISAGRLGAKIRSGHFIQTAVSGFMQNFGRATATVPAIRVL